jgi:hypothetical protein
MSIGIGAGAEGVVENARGRAALRMNLVRS